MGSVKFSGGTRECYAVLHTILCVLFRGVLVSFPLNAVFVLDCALRHTSIMYKQNSRGRKTHRESQESRARGAWCVHEHQPHQRSTSSERSTE